MDVGLRCYGDYEGNPLYVDMTSDISQMRGFHDTNRAGGTITVPAPPTGKKFFYFVADISTNRNGQGRRPGVSVTPGSTTYTLSWSYSFSAGFGNYAMNCRIHYGYY